jgi:hypothetical protein
VGAVAKSINLIIALTGNVHPDRSLVSILSFFIPGNEFKGTHGFCRGSFTDALSLACGGLCVCVCVCLKFSL